MFDNLFLYLPHFVIGRENQREDERRQAVQQHAVCPVWLNQNGIHARRVPTQIAPFSDWLSVAFSIAQSAVSNPESPD